MKKRGTIFTCKTKSFFVRVGIVQTKMNVDATMHAIDAHADALRHQQEVTERYIKAVEESQNASYFLFLSRLKNTFACSTSKTYAKSTDEELNKATEELWKAGERVSWLHTALLTHSEYINWISKS
jgi:hypothetical protein